MIAQIRRRRQRSLRPSELATVALAGYVGWLVPTLTRASIATTTTPTAAGMSSTRTAAKLSFILLLYYLGVVGVITLAPFRFAAANKVEILLSGGWFDIVANVLLFVPLGFLYPLTRPGAEQPSPSRALLLGLGLSTLIETTQVFEPDRFVSGIDVATNGAGAWLGALLLRAATRRISVNAKLVGRLSLEIPLMGLIYLLVPLMLMGSVGIGSRAVRMLPLLALGLFGARLFAAVQRYHFGPSGLLTNAGAAAVAGWWMVLGTYPVLRSYPLQGAAAVVIVAAWTWYDSSRPLPPAPGGGERRFESDALRGAAPYIAVYFILLVFLPLTSGTTDWRVAFGLTGWTRDLGAGQLRLMEPMAALTVLGYLLAEARGRRETSFQDAAPRLAVECGLMALAIEAARGFQLAAGGSVLQLVLLVGAGLLGGGIYHSQRDHVRSIVGYSRAPSPS
jgi:glycopeptide antibiotics resistance protein